MPMSPRLLRPRDTAFNPRSISGLALWLDASDSSTLFQNSDGTVPATATSDPVGYWADKSGNGRHAVQATAGSRPTRSVAINTRSAVLLANGAVQRLTANGVYMDALGDDTNKRITILATLQSSGQSQQKSIGEVDQSSGFGCYHNISNIAYFDAGAGAPASRAQGALASSVITGGSVFAGRRDGGNVNQWYNGALIAGGLTSATGSLRTAGDNPFSVRAVNSGSLAYGEVLVYNRALTTDERQRVERYLAARWGIALAPQVSNADAQDWVNRVYQNGGTVSSATAASVNTLCDSLESASLRDRFYRLNLFCGTGLNAALVPLYRGPSLGGTQYGNTTDTNTGPVVSGDFADATGLAAGSGKYLRTGLTQANVGTACHLAFYDCAKATNGYANRIGSRGASDTHEHAITNADVATTIDYASSAGAGNQRARATGYTEAGAFWLGVNPSATSAILYKNGVSAATATPLARTAQNLEYWLFALNNNGSLDFNQTTGRSGGYSIGAAMDATQAAAYNAAMQAFQTALTRNAT